MSTKDEVVERLQEEISAKLISDKSIKALDCADGLEELAEFCRDWAAQLRSENQ